MAWNEICSTGSLAQIAPLSFDFVIMRSRGLGLYKTLWVHVWGFVLHGTYMYPGLLKYPN